MPDTDEAVAGVRAQLQALGAERAYIGDPSRRLRLGDPLAARIHLCKARIVLQALRSA